MKPWEKAVIAGSLLITAALGGSFVFWYWFDRGEKTQAAVNSGLFVGIIAAIHYVAYRVYAAQLQQSAVALSEDNANATPSNGFWLLSPVSPRYHSALKVAAVQQVILLILTALLLDGGGTFRVFGVAAIAHWIMSAIIISRRPLTPTTLDLLIIRWSFVPMAVIIGRLSPIVLA